MLRQCQRNIVGHRGRQTRSTGGVVTTQTITTPEKNVASVSDIENDSYRQIESTKQAAYYKLDAHERRVKALKQRNGPKVYRMTLTFELWVYGLFAVMVVMRIIYREIMTPGNANYRHSIFSKIFCYFLIVDKRYFCQ